MADNLKPIGDWSLLMPGTRAEGNIFFSPQNL